MTTNEISGLVEVNKYNNLQITERYTFHSNWTQSSVAVTSLVLVSIVLTTLFESNMPNFFNVL